LPVPDPADDLALLTEAAQEAGRIAMRHFRRDPRTWEKSDGTGPVTEADLDVDAMLRQSLTAARPDYGWLSEETADTPDRLDRDTVFICDPIDGTRAFIDGQSAFAHALCVVRKGAPVAGVIYLPAQDRLYAAALGRGATLNGEPVRATDAAADGPASLLITKPALAARHWPGGVPDIDRHYRPSLAYRIALVAEGRFDGMVTFRATWEWDAAAGAIIAAEAEATVTDAQGAALQFNRPRPQVSGMIIAAPTLHGALMARR